MSVGQNPVPSSLVASTVVHPLDELLFQANALVIHARKRTQFSKAETARLSAARAVLQLLEQNGPQTVPELARNRFTSRQNIQIIVNRYATEGCVEIKPNPAHRKSSLVWLTEKGRQVLSSAATEKLGGRISLEDFSEAELRRAASVIQQVRERLFPAPIKKKPVFLPASTPAGETPTAVESAREAAAPADRPKDPEPAVVEDFPVTLL